MWLLPVTDAVRSEVARVVAFSEKKENRWRPSGSPSAERAREALIDRSQHAIRIGSFGCTFTHTEDEKGLWKHLVVRVTDGGKESAPHPVALHEIAKLFGFPDDPQAYQRSLDECRPPCAIVIAPIEWKDEALRRRWEAVHPVKKEAAR